MATETEREPMTSVDAAWLGMDRSTNLMIINGVMLFDEKIEYERFRRLCEERLVGQYERFRQRIVAYPSGTGRLYWELDPHFDIRAHLHHIALPEPGNKATLQRLVGELMSDSLDRYRPLWKFYLIDNYGSGCAVFGRLHHCIADGIALTQVLLSLTDSGPDELPPLSDNTVAKADENKVEPPAPVGENGLLSASRDMAGRAVGTATNLTGIAVQGGLQGLANPSDSLALAKSAGILAATSAAILAKLLIMAPDRKSVYRGELGAIKQVAWCEPLDLDEVKRIGRITNTTVNDVLVAVIAGALRQYSLERDDDAMAGGIRAMVPVSLRTPSAEPTLGNQFTLVYLSLPVHLSSPVQRLYEVKRRMDVLKNSPEPLIVYEVLNLIGAIPGELAKHATDWFASKATCVLTNVPGPRETLYFAGRPLRRLVVWVPQSGGIGLGISIFSYAGSVTIGLMVDDAIVPDPEAIIGHVHTEFADLSELATALATSDKASLQSADQDYSNK